MGRPIKHQQELGTEQSMELCCAGTRAKSKSSTSAPLLSTAHSHAGNGLKTILAAIVDCRGPPRSGERIPLSILLVQEENMEIRSTSRVRSFAQASRSTTSRWRKCQFLDRVWVGKARH